MTLNNAIHTWSDWLIPRTKKEKAEVYFKRDMDTTSEQRKQETWVAKDPILQ